MINRATYQAAKIVAPLIEEHFATLLEEASAAGEVDLAPQPPARVIEAIVDVAFWVSLRKEEGHSAKISLAFLPPEQSGKALLFKHTLPLNPNFLTKIAPGVERSGVYLGVWHDGYNLYVWGTTLTMPNCCLVVDVSDPALLVIKHRRIHGFGKFTNVAVLKGEQIKLINQKKAEKIGECPGILIALLDVAGPTNHNDYLNVMIQLAVSVRSHGRGGAVLVVPQNTHKWEQSVIQPITYHLTPAYNGLANLVRKDRSIASEIYLQAALKKEIEYIGGLTAIDGATVITDEYELLAFGVKTSRAHSNEHIQEILFFEPINDAGAQVIHPAKIGGTRHLSAAQFVFDQKDALALVASQDGHFTVFSWSEKLNIVQAQRIDALLL